MPLSRPRVLYPLRSVHLGIYICCCSPYCTHALPIMAILLLQSLLHACMAYHGLCLWPLVPTLWWTHQGDYRPQAQAE